MNCNTPGFPVLHYLLKFAQTRVHWVGDPIQPSHPALNLSQHLGLFQCWKGWNLGLLQCRQILYHMSHQESLLEPLTYTEKKERERERERKKRSRSGVKTMSFIHLGYEVLEIVIEKEIEYRSAIQEGFWFGIGDLETVRSSGVRVSDKAGGFRTRERLTLLRSMQLSWDYSDLTFSLNAF